MKNIRAKRETSREYLLKLMYQTYISNGDITDLENELEGFLENNQEYIISRYKELVLTYSDRDVNLDDVTVNKCVDKAYLTKVCDILRLRIDDINELIENDKKRKEFSNKALVGTEKFALSRISSQWKELLIDVMKEKKCGKGIEA